MISRKLLLGLSLCAALQSPQMCVASEEFTEDFATAVDRAYSPLTVPAHKALSSSYSLKQEDLLFQAAKNKAANNSPSLETFEDFIQRNKFFGRPILLRLDPPDEYTARKDLTGYLKEFQDAGKQVETLTSAFDANKKNINNRSSAIEKCTTEIEICHKKLFDLSDAEHNRVVRICDLHDLLSNGRRELERQQRALRRENSPRARAALESRITALRIRHAGQDAELRNLLAAQSFPPEAQRRQNLNQKIAHLTGVLQELQTANDLTATIADAEVKAVNVAKLYFPNLTENLDNASKSYSQSISPLRADTEGKATYLLIFNYNIPALKTSVFPFTSYSQVRFCCQLMTRYLEPNTQYPLTPPQPDLNYDDVSIETIWPRNQVITANFTNTKTLDLKAEPQWMGGSGGSIDWKNEDHVAYSYALPMTVGSSSKSGAVQWTMYPAKRQKIAYGNHTAYAVISIPRSRCQDILQVNSLLYYHFKFEKAIAGWPSHKEYVTTYIPFKDAVYSQKSIELVERVFGRTLSGDDETLLERLIRLKDPADPTKLPPPKDDTHKKTDSDKEDDTDVTDDDSKVDSEKSSKTTTSAKKSKTANK